MGFAKERIIIKPIQFISVTGYSPAKEAEHVVSQSAGCNPMYDMTHSWCKNKGLSPSGHSRSKLKLKAWQGPFTFDI